MRNTKRFLGVMLAATITMVPTIALADGGSNSPDAELVEEGTSTEALSTDVQETDVSDETESENTEDTINPDSDSEETSTESTVKQVNLLYLEDGSHADYIDSRVGEEFLLNLNYSEFCNASDLTSIAWAIYDDGASYSIPGLEFSNDYTFGYEWAGDFPDAEFTATENGLSILPLKSFYYYMVVALHCSDGTTYLDRVTLEPQDAPKEVYKECKGILSFKNSDTVLNAYKQEIMEGALSEGSSEADFEEWWKEYKKEAPLTIPVGETAHLNVDFQKAGGKDCIVSIEFKNLCDCEEESFDPAGSNPYYTMVPDETGYKITGKSVHMGILTIFIKRDGAANIKDSIDLRIVPKDYETTWNTHKNIKPSTVQTGDPSPLFFYEVSALISSFVIGALSVCILRKKRMK